MAVGNIRKKRVRKMMRRQQTGAPDHAPARPSVTSPAPSLRASGEVTRLIDGDDSIAAAVIAMSDHPVRLAR